MIFPRSILYTPAYRLERLEKSLNSGADVCLLDLEDSVPQALKEAARENTVSILKLNANKRHTAVRINPIGSADYISDLKCLLDNKVMPNILVMTMVCSSLEVDILRQCCQDADFEPLIFVTIETVQSIENLTDIANSADGFIFGSADLSAELGVEITWSNMLLARQRMVFAAAQYNIACIDTACYSLESNSELQQESLAVKDLGFHGKAAVHPNQVSPINKLFSLNKGTIAWANRVVDQSMKEQGKVIKIDGKMIGPPFVKKAKKLLHRAGRIK